MRWPCEVNQIFTQKFLSNLYINSNSHLSLVNLLSLFYGLTLEIELNANLKLIKAELGLSVLFFTKYCKTSS